MILAIVSASLILTQILTILVHPPVVGLLKVLTYTRQLFVSEQLGNTLLFLMRRCLIQGF